MRKALPEKTEWAVATARNGQTVSVNVNGIPIVEATGAQAAQIQALLDGVRFLPAFGLFLEEIAAQSVMAKSGWNDPSDAQVEPEEKQAAVVPLSEDTPKPTLTAQATNSLKRAATWLIS